MLIISALGGSSGKIINLILGYIMCLRSAWAIWKGREGQSRALGPLRWNVIPNLLPEKAGPAENVMVKEVWGTNALVEWQPPKDDGNSEITGYFVQKADKKTMVRGHGGLGGS